MKNLLEHLRLKRTQDKLTLERVPEPFKPIQAPSQPAFVPPTTPRAVRPAWHAPSVQRAPALVAPPALPEKPAQPEMITLTLGDFLDRIPAEFLDPKKPDPSIPMPFDIGILSERMVRANTMITLGDLFRRIPDIFRSSGVIPLDRKIVFPWTKVLAMVEQSRDGAVVPGLTRQSMESLAQKVQARKRCRQSKMAPLWGGITPAPEVEKVEPRTEESLFEPAVLPPPMQPESSESIQATVDELRGKLAGLQKSHDEILRLDQAIKAECDDANRRVAAIGLDHDRAMARIGEISAERDAALVANAKLTADNEAAIALATELSAERDAALKRAAELQTATAMSHRQPASAEPSAEPGRSVAQLTTHLEECLNTIQVLFREREAQSLAQPAATAQISATGAGADSPSAPTTAEMPPPAYVTILPQPTRQTNSRVGAALVLAVLTFGICAQHPAWRARHAGTQPLAGTTTEALTVVSTTLAAPAPPAAPPTPSAIATPEAPTEFFGPPPPEDLAPENPNPPEQAPVDQAPPSTVPATPPIPTDSGETTPGIPAPEVVAPSFTAEIFAEEKFTLEIPGAHESARMLIPKPLLKLDPALH